MPITKSVLHREYWVRAAMGGNYLFKPTLAVKCHCRNWWSSCYNMSSLMLGALKLLLIWLSDSLPGPETCGFLGEVSCPSCCWETYFNCKKQQSPFHAGVSGTRHCWWPTFGEPPLWFSLLEKEVYCNCWSKKAYKMRKIRKKHIKILCKVLKHTEISGNLPVLCSNGADRRSRCTSAPELVYARVNPVVVNDRPGPAPVLRKLLEWQIWQ